MAKNDNDNGMMKMMETMMKTMFMGPIYVMKAVSDLIDTDDEEKPAKKKSAARAPVEPEKKSAPAKPPAGAPRGWGPITPQDPNVHGWGEM